MSAGYGGLRRVRARGWRRGMRGEDEQGCVDAGADRELWAEEFGLEQAKIERRGKLWWRSVASRQGGLWMVAAGPYREGELRISEGLLR